MNYPPRSFVGEFRHNRIEFFKGEALVSWGLVVDVSAVQHFDDLIIIHDLGGLFGNILELLEIDDSILVFVKQGEDFLEAVFSLGLSHMRSNAVHKLIKVNGFVLILEGAD